MKTENFCQFSEQSIDANSNFTGKNLLVGEKEKASFHFEVVSIVMRGWG